VITVLFTNPFLVPDIPAVDGQGLLAILQHPAMVYHPPILYLGLTVLVITFARAVEAGMGRVERDTWLSETRRWLYASWVLLTMGMAAGASWAYVELGWGGYWAWDPVENTALMPWIAATVFFHTSRIEATTGRLRRWNVMCAALPFALTVMGVYLTRSGVTGSIHSFAEDPEVGRILLTSSLVVALLVVLVAARSEPGEKWGRFTLDRSGWLSVNALFLTSALVFVTAGSAYPAFASLFFGESVSVDTRFFVVTVLPIAILAAIGLTSALGGSLRAYLLASAVVAILTLAVVGAKPGVMLMVPAAASLAVLGYETIVTRFRGRLLTARLAHLGMALFLVGVAGSAFGARYGGSMMPGDTVIVADHEVTLDAVTTGETDRYVYVRATFSVDGKVMTPEIRAYEDQTMPVAEPELRSTLVDDVILAVSLLFPDGSTVAVSVFVLPLVWWVWVGAATMGLAGLFALFSRAGAAAAPHLPATAAPRREGTTTGTASR
jgi:cytochrome c-type biogenesis protein CcmF